MLDDKDIRAREILSEIKPLAAEFYRLTGKPLGVTGEVAEFVAAEALGLQLAPARTCGYDALRGAERIQIKGRAYGANAPPQPAHVPNKARCRLRHCASGTHGQCNTRCTRDVGSSVFRSESPTREAGIKIA